MSNEDIDKSIEILSELQLDASIPKNVRIRIEHIINALKEDAETPIKKNKALSELDKIADDSNLQPYTRTQVWNVVSILEKIQ